LFNIFIYYNYNIIVLLFFVVDPNAPKVVKPIKKAAVSGGGINPMAILALLVAVGVYIYMQQM
jgi:hypothetical protein